MSHEFFKIKIQPNSQILKYLAIIPGSYRMRWDSSSGELKFFHDKNHKEILSLRVSPEEFTLIRLFLDNITDKYTAEEKDQIKNVFRSKHFQGEKDYPAHHIIPFQLFKTSKLLLAANRLNVFYNDHPDNRLVLPASFHKGSHPKYSRFVEDVLEGEWSDIVKFNQESDAAQIKHTIYQILRFLKDKIREMRADGLVSIDNI
ncbi:MULTISPECIES: AHH domain-containing protein [Spirulina sp. CCY15215]|uniref:AHH domain-containing protein n=1 Tax=Spirulina sp. CCY15215 TaxID=2767591 RepID=UPI001950120E|nr:AHH domain-containing protein [Spirulina major]